MPEITESVLIVTGDCVWVNTFDAAFRRSPGPNWRDHPSIGLPRYSLHNLHPIPENILQRGYENVGALWCRRNWSCDGDLIRCAVQRSFGRRVYRMLTPGGEPSDALLYAAYHYSSAKVELVLINKEQHQLVWHRMDAKYQQTTMTPRINDLEEALNKVGISLPPWDNKP